MTEASLSCAFNGFGKHTVYNFLFLVAVFPGAPASYVCATPAVWERFSSQIACYMAHFRSDAFRKQCCGKANSLNAFDYNYTAGSNYYSSEVLVFRKHTVRVPKELYNTYIRDGLLDDAHTMGKS